jgi:hypothetical protein
VQKTKSSTTLLSFIILILLSQTTVVLVIPSFALNHYSTRYSYCTSEAANNYGLLTLYHLSKCPEKGFLSGSSQESIGESAVINGISVFSNLLPRNLDVNNHMVYITTALGNGVQLSAIHTQPQVLRVGNIFHISVIIFNNSPNTLRYIAGPCDSAISAKFDRNILVKHGFGCLLAARLISLKPGEMGTAIGPSIGTTYQAVAAGITKASIVFHYQLEKAVSLNVTKSFVFDVT